MSQHDMNVANQGFPAFRSDLNNALAALVSNSSSATEPTTTFAYMFWADTTNDLLKQRNAANDGWINILVLSTGEPASADVATVVASQAEMEAGTESALRSMSPLRVAQAISALAVSQGKNAIINGNFDIWQRGTSFTGTGDYYSADRWQTYRSGAAAGATFSRANNLDDKSTYYLKMQRDNGNTSTAQLVAATALETIDSYKFEGQQVTLSVQVIAGANANLTNSVQLNIVSGTGTDQNLASGFTNQATVATSTISPTTGFVKYTVTGTVGAGISQIGVQVLYTPTGTAGADDSIGICNVQLEFGDTATDFDFRPYAEELALCQRYYEKCDSFDGNSLFWAGAATAGSQDMYNSCGYAVHKRVAATVTVTQFEGAGVFSSLAGATSNDVTGFRADSLSTGAGYGYWRIKWTADSEL